MSRPEPGEPVDDPADGPVVDPGQRPADPPPVPSAEEVAAELAAEPAVAAEPAPEGRRYPSTIGGACYLAVLVGTAVGLGITVTGDWRLGVRWMSGALLAAALLRLVLPARDAGMLAVRHRFLDALLYAGLATALTVLTVTIPNQPLV